MLYTSLNIPAQSSLFLLAALESRPFLRPKPLPPHTLRPHTRHPLRTPWRIHFGESLRGWGGFGASSFSGDLYMTGRVWGFGGFGLSAPFIPPLLIVKVACQSYTRPDKCHWYLIKSGRPGVQNRQVGRGRSPKWYSRLACQNPLGWLNSNLSIMGNY